MDTTAKIRYLVATRDQLIATDLLDGAVALALGNQIRRLQTLQAATPQRTGKYHRPNRVITLHDDEINRLVFDMVAAQSGQQVSDILAPGVHRKVYVVEARAVMATVLTECVGLTVAAASLHMGYKDHTTLSGHLLHKVNADPKLRRRVDEIKKQLAAKLTNQPRLLRTLTKREEARNAA